MPNNDRSTQQDFDDLREVMEDKFSTLARLHDTVLAEAVKHWDANARSANALEVAKAQHHSRKADVIKAVMLFRFPEASDAWFD